MWWLPLLLAPFVGSFLGVLIRRLPRGEPVGLARSRCESCRHTLGPADLLPVVSFLRLRGLCRYCRAPIARAHLAIELAALAVAASAAAVCAGTALWAGCALGWVLLALGWIDWEHFFLPDLLTLPLLLGGLLCTWALAPWALADHALAAALGYGGLRLAGLLYAWRRGIEGIGQGDAKLLAAAGAWLGLLALPQVILLAALGGLLIAGGLWMAGGRVGRTTALPFGTTLAAATWLVFLVGAS